MLQLSGFGMILLMLAGVMFPLWPTSMRVGVWYLSVGMLGLIGAFFGLAIVRLILWCITVLTVKPGIWIFPNLFEDVGFVDSFIPLWAWDIPPPPKKKKVAPSTDEKGGQKAITVSTVIPANRFTEPQHIAYAFCSIHKAGQCAVIRDEHTARGCRRQVVWDTPCQRASQCCIDERAAATSAGTGKRRIRLVGAQDVRPAR